MSSEVDVFLSDEFVMFSQKMAELHSAKKAKQEEMAKFFEKAKEEIKEINEQAVKEKVVWDEFVLNHKKK